MTVPELAVLAVVAGGALVVAGVTTMNWHWRAARAHRPAGERRRRVPLLVDAPPPIHVGYRETRVDLERSAAEQPLAFERALDRGPNIRVLENPAHLAVRFHLTVHDAVVRIVAAREGDEVVLRAAAHVIPAAAAEWDRRARDLLDPLMDELLDDLAGTPRTGVAQGRHPIERRGWPK